MGCVRYGSGICMDHDDGDEAETDDHSKDTVLAVVGNDKITIVRTWETREGEIAGEIYAILILMHGCRAHKKGGDSSLRSYCGSPYAFERYIRWRGSSHMMI